MRYLLCAALVAVMLTPSADATRPDKPKRDRGGVTITATLTDAQIRAVHDDVCPQVTEYADCGALTVTVAAYGSTGWTARSGPAAGTVEYNSSYAMTAAGWAQTVAHEVGGHHDAWAELVTKVGTAQAWTDWGDLGTFGQAWAVERFAAMGAPRSLSLLEGKEIYLDCAGPVSHGYRGNYLTNRGVPAADQPEFCNGHESVMTRAAG